MNKETFTYCLKNAAALSSENLAQLDEVVASFPYFQCAQALQLKGLKQNNSFKYNQALKKTAAHTIDRSVLFDFITSLPFSDNVSKVTELEDIEVIDLEVIEALHEQIKTSINQHLDEVSHGQSDPEIKQATQSLDLGKPINFKGSEPHSFNEWMQLISQKPIKRNTDEEENDLAEDTNSLIDKFIQANPKIKPAGKNVQAKLNPIENSLSSEHIMTETLAKVYLEQKKYENAIKAYRILSLKYPKKSGFFADQIKAIKILQKNNS